MYVRGCAIMKEEQIGRNKLSLGILQGLRGVVAKRCAEDVRIVYAVVMRCVRGWFVVSLR